METFRINLVDLQPSQLYICSEKLSAIESEMQRICDNSIEPLPVRRIGSKIVLTDGHTRAFVAFRKGLNYVTVYWDTDELYWEAYEICVEWCIQKNIHSVVDLQTRIISLDQYEKLWRERCRRMREQLVKNRKRIKAQPSVSGNGQDSGIFSKGF